MGAKWSLPNGPRACLVAIIGMIGNSVSYLDDNIRPIYCIASSGRNLCYTSLIGESDEDDGIPISSKMGAEGAGEWPLGVTRAYDNNNKDPHLRYCPFPATVTS